MPTERPNFHREGRLPEGTLIVTPGIQLSGSGGTDQVRFATTQVARRNGATHVVIGRSITQAASPLLAFQEAVAGMAPASGD